MPLISNGEDGLSVRNSLNNEFLYRINARNIDVISSNTASENKANLQAAIDEYTLLGADILFDEPVPMDGGLILKSNVRLIGNNRIALKGSAPLNAATPALGETPAGGAFLITDETNVFLTVQNSTGVYGMIFYYPEQNYAAASFAELVTYPTTIKQHASYVQGVVLSGLCFVGETRTIDFTDTSRCQDLVFEYLYGYPTSGSFLAVSNCDDIPRINCCHVNPGAGRVFLGAIPYVNYTTICDYIAANGGYAFDLNSVDEFMVSQCFVFGVAGGFRCSGSYGTFFQCEADMVQVGFKCTVDAHKVVNIVGANVIPGGGAWTDRYGYWILGNGGAVNISLGSGFVGTNPVIPASGTAKAVALVLVDGAGEQCVSLSGGRATSVSSGSTGWERIFKVNNASAKIDQFGTHYTRSTVKGPANAFRNVELGGLALSSAVTVSSLGSEVANKLVPVTLADGTTGYLPMYVPTRTTLFNDTFTGVNGTALASHTPNTGGAWTDSTPGWQIQSNRAQSASAAVSNANMTAADGVLTCTLVTLGGNSAVDFRRIDDNNFLRFAVNSPGSGSGLLFIRVIAGVVTVSDAFPYNYDTGAPHAVKVIMEGVRVQVYLDGYKVFDESTDTIPTGTRAGLKVDVAGTIVDDFLFQG